MGFKFLLFPFCFVKIDAVTLLRARQFNQLYYVSRHFEIMQWFSFFIIYNQLPNQNLFFFSFSLNNNNFWPNNCFCSRITNSRSLASLTSAGYRLHSNDLHQSQRINEIQTLTIEWFEMNDSMSLECGVRNAKKNWSNRNGWHSIFYNNFYHEEWPIQIIKHTHLTFMVIHHTYRWLGEMIQTVFQFYSMI